MRISPRYSLSSLSSLAALSLSAVAACSGGDSVSAPSFASQGVLAVLQYEWPTNLPSSLNDRLTKAAVAWTPPLGDEYVRLFVPAEVIEVADTVRVGVAVPIVVNSIGENGCWQADGATIAQHGDTAIVKAYDRHSGAAACTQVWTDRLRHEVTTTFPRVGTGIVRAVGRRARLADPKYSAEIVAERTVVVVP